MKVFLEVDSGIQEIKKVHNIIRSGDKFKVNYVADRYKHGDEMITKEVSIDKLIEVRND